MVVREIRERLKSDVDAYLNLSRADKLTLNNSTVIFVDSDIGFSYSDGFGFARSSSYVPPGYNPHQNETCSLKQPANAVPIPRPYSQGYFSILQTFSDYKISMACWSRYYQEETYQTNVYPVK